VGPKYIGKSVLLMSLAEHFQPGKDAFRASLYWDLRHSTPDLDLEFLSQFASRLVAPVRTINPEYATELEGDPAESLKRIRMVFELLKEEGVAVLICLDGCDNLLLGSNVTRNLWDNLRALAEMDSLRFVTASRRRLRDLCHSPESKTSDFWNIFGNPFTLNAMSDDDIEGFVQFFQSSGVEIGTGAFRELVNWSGGIPVLVAAHCLALWDPASGEKQLSKALVDGVGKGLHLSEQDALREVWEDCSEEQRTLAARAYQRQLADTDATNPSLVTSLIERGIVRLDGRRILGASRVLENFLAQGAGGRSNLLAALFGTDEGYAANAKGFLQLRFALLAHADKDVLDYLRNAIENLDNPKVLIRMIRALVERSFEMIWDRSIPDRRIPSDWSAEWKQPDRDGNFTNYPPEGVVSGRLGKQCQLLDLMTDPRKNRRTPVRRSTYVLIEGLQTAGDFGQHLEGEVVPHGFGVTVCMSALQAVEQLSVDLQVLE
jgi:hypothetical protein